MSPPARINEVSWPGLPDHDRESIRLIYEDVFPPTERRPFESLTASGTRVWVARRADHVIGFATAIVFERVGAGLLRYLAVTPPEQSRSVGSTLLAVLARDLPVDGVLIEVEVPSLAGVMAKRRLAFYERWGAQRLECLEDYFMADFSKPGERIPMILLWKPLAAAEQPRGQRLRAALEAIFESAYTDVAGADHLADLLANVRC
jgi:GNAT superfamily N-acetyltransferase